MIRIARRVDIPNMGSTKVGDVIVVHERSLKKYLQSGYEIVSDGALEEAQDTLPAKAPVEAKTFGVSASPKKTKK